MTETVFPPGIDTSPDMDFYEATRPDDRPLSIHEHKGIDKLLDESARLGLLTADEEVQLSRRIRQGDLDAKEEMVMRNLRLIPIAVKKFMHQGMSFEDLFMEGFFGLDRAAELFEPELKNRFSTYAVRSISRTVRRAVDNRGRSIHIPLHVQQRQQTLNLSRVVLEREKGAEPKFEDIVKHSGLPLGQAQEAWNAPEAEAILNAKIGDEGKNELIDLIPDKSVQIHHEEDEDELDKDRVKKALIKAIDKLPDNSKTVVTKLFGLDGGPSYTQDEVAQILGLKPKTVESLYQKTLIDLFNNEELKETVGIEEEAKPVLPDSLPVYIQVGDEVKHFSFQQFRIMTGIRDGMSFREMARRQQMNLSSLKWQAHGSRSSTIYSKLGVSDLKDAATKLKEVMPTAEAA
jgi:RNA polymerase primary sigma factor